MRWIWDLRVGLALMAVAVIATHLYFFRAGFRLTPGDPSDAALVSYLLERDYRWATGAERHGFWNPPSYYPHLDTATYTDLLVGVVPFYMPFRLLGAGPQTAFQLWVLLVGCLNYIGLYVLSRKLLHYGEAASNAAAFLFACGSARLIQEWHPQLAPEFYAVMSLAGLVLLFRTARPRPIAGSVLLFSGIVLQAYTAIYWAFFTWFCLALAAGFAVLRKEWRSRLISRSVANVRVLGLVGAASLLALNQLSAGRGSEPSQAAAPKGFAPSGSASRATHYAWPSRP
jgi:hypothetical protein